MTTLRPPRPSSAAHPVLDWLERSGGIVLVAGASVMVAAAAFAIRLMIPA